MLERLRLSALFSGRSRPPLLTPSLARRLDRLRVWMMLLPALLVIIGLFLGGLILGAMQSLGYMPIIGRTDVSLAAYQAIFTSDDFLRSLALTTWIGVGSTTISTLLAIGCALILRQSFRGKRWITFIFQLNLPIPHIVGAIGILFLFSQSGFLARLAYLGNLIERPADFPALIYDRYAIGIMLEYIWKTTTFTGVIILAVLQSIGEDYEDAARNLGASRWQRFRHVTLPLIMPGVLSSSVLVFAFTFGAFEVPFLLGQRFPSALPVLAYRSYVDVDLNARPEAMAMSVIIALIITGLVFLYMRLSRLYLRD